MNAQKKGQWLLHNLGRLGQFLGQLLLEPARCLLCGDCVEGLRPDDFCPLCTDFFANLYPIKTTLLGDDPILPELVCFSGGFYEGPLQEAIYQIKYLKRPELALAMRAALIPPAVSLAEHISLRSGEPNKRPLILPVPLHTAKKRERGFNQAELLGSLAAELLKGRLESGGLRRLRATSPQFGLSRSARRENLDGAFAGPAHFPIAASLGRRSTNILTDRDVIIVDDVVTSGATLYECARTAAACGANVVGALTLARARWHDQAKNDEQQGKQETTLVPALARADRWPRR
jgi:predicted amidophosphoribosyltransferase